MSDQADVGVVRPKTHVTDELLGDANNSHDILAENSINKPTADGVVSTPTTSSTHDHKHESQAAGDASQGIPTKQWLNAGDKGTSSESTSETNARDTTSSLSVVNDSKVFGRPGAHSDVELSTSPREHSDAEEPAADGLRFRGASGDQLPSQVG